MYFSKHLTNTVRVRSPVQPHSESRALNNLPRESQWSFQPFSTTTVITFRCVHLFPLPVIQLLFCVILLSYFSYNTEYSQIVCTNSLDSVFSQTGPSVPAGHTITTTPTTPGPPGLWELSTVFQLAMGWSLEVSFPNQYPHFLVKFLWGWFRCVSCSLLA